jgi:SWIM/SEC-C metal-binding protein
MAKLGTSRRPVIARVQTEERAGEIAAVCEEHGWKFTIGIEPDKPENISDILKLLKPSRPAAPDGFTPRRSRNDYCPCGSGQKYKNCCWDKDNPKGVANQALEDIGA